MGRWLSPDWSAKEEPVPYSKLDNPQTLNLYQYGLNNPLTVIDTDGHELKVAVELQDQVATMRQQSPSFNAELSAYEGAKAPNLTIQFGATPNDPSGQPSIGNTSAPVSVDLVVSHDPKDDNYLYGPPKDTTITVNDSIKGDSKQVQDVLGHETGHAHDARTNSNQYGHDSEHTKETKGKTPHDDRPEEKRANQFKDTVNHEMKQYQKDHKHDQ